MSSQIFTHAKATEMDEIVKINLIGRGTSHILNEPVPAILTVVNTGTVPIELLLPYPNPNNLIFKCLGDVVLTKPLEQNQPERTVPLHLEPGEEVQKIYYLNRYLSFASAGRYLVSYFLELPITIQMDSGEKHEVLLKNGSFDISIEGDFEEKLQKILDQYSIILGHPDPEKRNEAAEALFFLDTPLVIPYLRKMLAISGMEQQSILALGRHAASKEIIESLSNVLDHPEAAVVGTALTELDKINADVPRGKVHLLLKSRNASIRLLGINWLAFHHNENDIEFVTPLLEDSNPVVKEKATDLYRLYR